MDILMNIHSHGKGKDFPDSVLRIFDIWEDGRIALDQLYPATGADPIIRDWGRPTISYNSKFLDLITGYHALQ